MKVNGMDANSMGIKPGEFSRTAIAATSEIHEIDRELKIKEADGNTISEKTVIEAIEKANRAVSVAYRRFEYSIHEKTKEIMVKVIDTETDEVIREIPPEKILDLVAMIWEMAGLIVDERR